MAYAFFQDEDGQASVRLLDPEAFHWSFHVHTGGSVMFGNDMVDNGDGSFSTTDRAVTRYSELDKYLMGLIPAAAVPDFFYVANPNGFRDATPPTGGARYFGDRADVGVEDVIAVEGPRLPASDEAPKAFRMAFLVVGPEGRAVSQASIDKVDRIRRDWGRYFREATDHQGEVGTRLVPR